MLAPYRGNFHRIPFAEEAVPAVEIRRHFDSVEYTEPHRSCYVQEELQMGSMHATASNTPLPTRNLERSHDEQEPPMDLVVEVVVAALLQRDSHRTVGSFAVVEEAHRMGCCWGPSSWW